MQGSPASVAGSVCKVSCGRLPAQKHGDPTAGSWRSPQRTSDAPSPEHPSPKPPEHGAARLFLFCTSTRVLPIELSLPRAVGIAVPIISPDLVFLRGVKKPQTSASSRILDVARLGPPHDTPLDTRLGRFSTCAGRGLQPRGVIRRQVNPPAYVCTYVHTGRCCEYLTLPSYIFISSV